MSSLFISNLVVIKILIFKLNVLNFLMIFEKISKKFNVYVLLIIQNLTIKI